MRMIISSILVILYHQMLTGVADHIPQSSGNNCTQNSIVVEDQGSAYSGVKMYFGDSFCQRIIQDDVTNAVKNACIGTNTPQRSSDDYKALTSRIDLLDKKVEDLLQRLGVLVLSTSHFTHRQDTQLKLVVTITICSNGFEGQFQNELCASIHFSGNLLTTIFLLHAGKETCTNGYEYYQSDKIWYKCHSKCTSWTEARLICNEEGGDLISLNENNFEFFKNVTRSKAGDCQNVWVGATDSNSEAKWKWLNGEEVELVFWENKKKPDKGNQHCGDLIRAKDYKLNDNVCSNKEHFICQIV